MLLALGCIAAMLLAPVRAQAFEVYSGEKVLQLSTATTLIETFPGGVLLGQPLIFWTRPNPSPRSETNWLRQR